MKIVASMFLVAAFGFNLFAQAVPKIEDVKPSQSQEFIPYLFNSYNAGYGLSAEVFGIRIDLLKYSVKITELEDEWIETLYADVVKSDFGDSPKQIEDDFEVGSGTMDLHIDLKTGLQKRIEIQGEITTDKGQDKTVEQLIVTENNELRATYLETSRNKKPKEIYNFKVENNEKIYPCLSTTFLSYLPLTDDFVGTFNCLSDGITDRGESLIFTKQTIRVVGSEKITTEAGTFECYKLEQKTAVIGYYDLKGEFKISKDSQKKAEGNLLKGAFSNSWVDKKTHKLVKAKMRMFKKLIGFDVELEPQTYRNL